MSFLSPPQKNLVKVYDIRHIIYSCFFLFPLSHRRFCRDLTSQIKRADMSNSTDIPTQTIPEDKAIAYFELAVSLYLWRWPALTLAVSNEWGGPDSSEKRDWLAGTLADMFTTSKSSPPEIEDIEDVATQVLNDEFSVVLEDDSAYDLATAICLAWTDCQDGRFDKIEQLKVHFQNSKPTAPVAKKQQQKTGDETTAGEDSDSSSGTDAELDGEEGEEGGQTAGTAGAMDLDPAPVPTRQEPVVDEDGFELVQAKGKGGRRR